MNTKEKIDKYLNERVSRTNPKKGFTITCNKCGATQQISGGVDSRRLKDIEIEPEYTDEGTAAYFTCQKCGNKAWVEREY